MLYKSEDDIIYVTFKDFESVKEIHRRVAKVKNDEIKVMYFIPPQFWDRYCFLSKHSANLRAEKRKLRLSLGSWTRT